MAAWQAGFCGLETEEVAISKLAEFPVARRKHLMAFLVAMFAIQTYLVYRDPTGRELPQLSEAALEGREIWLANNCQACHQFYGFGGFLGPDLTNTASRLDRARLDLVLTEGKAQMPAFHLTAAQISAVATYLREMDATGVGQARAPRPNPLLVTAAVRDSFTHADSSDPATRGAGIFVGGPCTACHAMLSPNRIGAYLAPDLSLAVSSLSDREILDVLETGRPTKGMPPSGLTPERRRDVVAFLHWLADRRPSLLQAGLAGQELGLPWWEFR